MNLSIEYLNETSGLTFKDISGKQCFRPITDDKHTPPQGTDWVGAVFYKWVPTPDLTNYSAVDLITGEPEFFDDAQPVIRVFATLTVER